MKRLTTDRMTQRTNARRRKGESSAPIIPSHEGLLTFVMTTLAESHFGMSARERQRQSRFARIERTTGKANFDKYPDLVRSVMALGMDALGTERGELLQSEFSEFLKRYELLHWQVIVGRATRQQVMWVLAHRFFLPWLALRIAFRSSKRPRSKSGDDADWFVPIREGRLYSAVMKLVDRFVRHQGESNAQLALRLQRLKPADPALPKFSLNAKREEDAEHLRENLSKYCHFKSSPPMETLELLAASTKSAPRLQQMFVLARFADRCVADALSVFEEPQVLKLVKFFTLCLRHVEAVVEEARRDVDASQQDKVQCLRFNDAGEGVPEKPASRAERVWLALHSMSLMGNSPGQQARFLPLMDEYMNELPRKISAELHRTVQKRKLSVLPRDHAKLNSGKWQFPEHVPIPEQIEGAPIRATVKEAVEVSQKTFSGRRINLVAVERARWKFEFMGLGTFVMKAQGRHSLCTDEDAQLAEAECKRLFLLTHGRLREPDRSRRAVDFLKYLIEPYRPKAPQDWKLANELFKVVSTHFRRNNLEGAVHYLRGCLLALADEHHAALQCFKQARSLGREACAPFWMDVLRTGLVTAQRAKSPIERKRFAHTARLFGLFTKDPTPRTNMMKEQMMEQAFIQADQAAFKPFPARKPVPRQRRPRR